MFDWFNNLDATTQAVIFTGLKAVVCFAIMMTMFAYTVVLERRLCAHAQTRSKRRTLWPLRRLILL